MLYVLVCQHWSTFWNTDPAKYLGSLYRAWKIRCFEGRVKTAKILRRQHPRDLFFHHQVFEGPERGLLASFKTWPLKEVVAANTVTLLSGSLVLKPDHCAERNTNSRGQNVQPGTASGLHKGPMLVSKKTQKPKTTNLTKTSPFAMLPTFPQLFTVLYRFSMWTLISESPYSVSHFLFIKKISEE